MQGRARGSTCHGRPAGDDDELAGVQPLVSRRGRRSPSDAGEAAAAMTARLDLSIVGFRSIEDAVVLGLPALGDVVDRGLCAVDDVVDSLATPE